MDGLLFGNVKWSQIRSVCFHMGIRSFCLSQNHINHLTPLQKHEFVLRRNLEMIMQLPIATFSQRQRRPGGRCAEVLNGKFQAQRGQILDPTQSKWLSDAKELNSPSSRPQDVALQ